MSRLPRGNGPISRTLREHDAALRRGRLLTGPAQSQVQTPGGVIVVPKSTATARRTPPTSGANVWQ